MDPQSVFRELFGRLPALVEAAVDRLDEELLARRVAPGTNPIGWLIWHLTRVQDDHVAGAAAALGRDQLAEQLYVTGGWAERFGLPADASDIGYGHTDAQVDRVRPRAHDLLDHHAAVTARTEEFLDGLDAEDFDRVVDSSWDPPVTLLVRLASVVGDVDQHVGQAAFLRGVFEAQGVAR